MKQGDRVRVRYTNTGYFPELFDTTGTFKQYWGFTGCLVEVDSRKPGNLTLLDLCDVEIITQ